MTKSLSSCTSVIVGKKASIDGSVMIARNDDTFLTLTPQKFVMHPANNHQDRTLSSTQNGFVAPLPKQALRYQATPNVELVEKGLYEESGINSANVAMSATESFYGNPMALAHDPLVKDGMAEDTLQTMVLPYIYSAREGVKRLGTLIKQYGSPEGNGVLFADCNEAWYMEIVTGHHWIASKIPDDSYVIVANQIAQDQINFNEPNNFMWSERIIEFVDDYHLNPDKNGWSVRHIFGTNTEKDRYYNTPRVWFGQRYFNPENIQEPTSSRLPFICHANFKISVDDIEYILSSHYNETNYDPLGYGPENDKVRFRPISMNRTQNSHILQIRNDVDKKRSAIFWLCFGVPAFTPYVPFFANSFDTDASYTTTPIHADSDSAYWMYRKLSFLVESHYNQFIEQDIDYLFLAKETFQRHLQITDVDSLGLIDNALTEYLTEQNHKIVANMRIATMDLINTFFEKGLTLSKLTFNMDNKL